MIDPKFLVNNVISNSARYGLIKQNEFFEKEIANKENIDGYYVIEKNDFVYNPRKSNSAPYGPICVYGYDEPGVVSPLYLCFRAVKEINVHFYNAYFSSAVWHKYISAHGDMGARHDRVSIQDSVFFDMPISTPPLSEQNKIADYLTCIDNAIIAQEAKLDNIRAMKRGALAKIFSREWRFRDENGQKFPEWEEKNLSDYFPSIRNGFVGTINPFYTDKERGIRYLQGTNIHDGAIRDDVEYYVTYDFSHAHPNSVLALNDILIVQSGHIGETAVVDEKYTGANCHALIVLSNGGNCCSHFVVYYLYSPIGRRQLHTLVKGNTIKHLLASDVEKLIIFFPCLAEQHKIADYFLRLDKIIETESATLDAMRKIKHGLLQRLFV